MGQTEMRNLILLLVLVLGFVNCRKAINESTESRGIGDVVQLDGCARGSLQKESEADSCFTWSFTENLTADFCVKANCCPDTDRFQLDYSIEAGAIHVTVQDTAQNLCRCICPYLIHAEFSELEKDSYHFFVEYNDSVLYDMQVIRMNLFDKTGI